MSHASWLDAANPNDRVEKEYAQPALPPDRPGDASSNRAALALVVAILLIIFASRVTRLNTLDMQQDEVWSVWQTLGTPQQVISWTPYDWSPTFYLVVDGWQNLTGLSPFTLRLLPIFVFMIGVALLYRIAHKWYGVRSAIMAIMVLSALAYILFLSTLLRGYIFILTFWILALWLTLRYFERPTWRRAVLLSLTLVLLFYIHVSSIFGMVMIGIMTVIFYGRRIWRWWLPGVITAVLCIPEAVSKIPVAATKTFTPEFFFTLPILAARVISHYNDYVGLETGVWIVLFLVASALMVERWVVHRRSIALVLWMLGPVWLVITATYFGSFSPRHLPWIMVGIAIWIGAGLAMLPRAARIALGVVFVILMFGYIPLHERYEIDQGRAPLVAAFRELKQQVRTGDVLFIDPICNSCTGAAPEEWDYFSRATFPPNGLKFVTDPGSFPRVWYVAAKGHEDPTVYSRLQQTRAQSATIGSDSLLFRLYEAPPDPQGLVFENGLRFNGVEALNNGVSPLVWHEGDTVRLRLWWSVTQAITADLSEGTFFFKPDGSIATSHDSAPQILNGPPQTSQWLIGRYYLEEHDIQLPYPLDTGNQALLLTIYQSWDGKRLSAPGMSADNLLTIKQIPVKAW